MSETLTPSSTESGNPDLSARIEKLDKDIGSSYLPEGHVQGEPVIGLPINAAFNKGVPLGPWKASEESVQRHVDEGWTREEALSLHDTAEKARLHIVNEYPLNAQSGSASDLTRQADEIIRNANARMRADSEAVK